MVGGSIQDNPNTCALASPISYVRKDNPPFLIFHGDKDPLVPLCQSEKLIAQLQKQGVKAELIIVKGGGHGPGVMIDTYYKQMITFFNAEMKK